MYGQTRLSVSRFITLHSYRHESKLILKGGIIRACGLGSVNIAVTAAMYLVFTVYAATGGELSPGRVFSTLSLVIVVRLIALQWNVHNVLNSFEGWVALVRLQVSTAYTRIQCIYIHRHDLCILACCRISLF